MTLGLSVWLSCEVFVKSEIWPAQIVGLFAAIAGMLVGSLLPQKLVAYRSLPEHLRQQR
jgi:hypothetical protein